MANKAGMLHTPESLHSLAAQLREEADRCDARAKNIDQGFMEISCNPGCWQLLSSCIFVEPQ